MESKESFRVLGLAGVITLRATDIYIYIFRSPSYRASAFTLVFNIKETGRFIERS